MKVELWQVGQTAFPYLKEGIEIYKKRLSHYLPFDIITYPDIKNAKSLSQEQLKTKEGEMLLKKLDKGDFLLLLDERGKRFTSEKFAHQLDNWLQQSYKRLIFVIGGAYGFSKPVYERANSKISLSDMTFSHQMIRLFATEQIYRAMTILRNQPYHHQ